MFGWFKKFENKLWLEFTPDYKNITIEELTWVVKAMTMDKKVYSIDADEFAKLPQNIRRHFNILN